MRRSIDVDTSRLPFVVTIMHGAMHASDVRAMQQQFEQLFAAQTRFVTITDARAMHGIPTGALRRVITEWNVRYEAETAAYNVAAVAIFESAITRAALRVIHWVAPHPSPYEVVASPEQAVAIACKHLAEAGIPLPPDLDMDGLMGTMHTHPPAESGHG